MSVQLGAPATAMRAHEELFGYWSGLRRGSRLPRRADIDPEGFKRLLPTVSLIDVEAEPRDYRLRLAGTGLWGVYGGEITVNHSEDVDLEENIAVSRNVPGRTAPLAVSASTRVLVAESVFFGGTADAPASRGNVVADPLFVHSSTDPRTADFRLRPESPARGLGAFQ